MDERDAGHPVDSTALPSRTRAAFRFSLRDLLVLLTAVAALAAEVKAVGLPFVALVVLAVLVVMVARGRRVVPTYVLLLAVAVVILFVLWLLLPDIQ